MACSFNNLLCRTHTYTRRYTQKEPIMKITNELKFG